MNNHILNQRSKVDKSKLSDDSIFTDYEPYSITIQRMANTYPKKFIPSNFEKWLLIPIHLGLLLFAFICILSFENRINGAESKNEQRKPTSELAEFHFKPAAKRSGTGMRLQQLGPNAVRFAMTSAAKFGSESMIANFQYESMAQQKLVFRVKGRPENGTAFFHPIIIIQNGNRLKSISGPRIPANGGDWHLYVLGLDTDFQLGDARYTIKRLEFSFNSAREPLNKELSAELEKIRFANPNEINNQNKMSFKITRASDSRFSYLLKNSSNSDHNIQKEKQIAVYFDFDNNDLASQTSMSRKKLTVPNEYCGDFGYRNLLIENCSLFRIADKPETAQLIVYQRTTESKDAKSIAQLVRKGKPIVFYGSIPDKELAELAPMKLTRLPNNRFAPRENLKVLLSKNSDGDIVHLTKSLPIQTCTFGRYFDAHLNEGASVLLAFAQSQTPYFAQKGKILHFAGTSGTNLIASQAFYDKAALLYWSTLTGIPQAPEILNSIESKIAKKDSLTEEGKVWEKTTRGFGRFGWLVSESGLVDSVSSDLTIFNGDQLYRIDVRPNQQNQKPTKDPLQKSDSNLSKSVSSLSAQCNEISKEYIYSTADKEATVSMTMSLLTPFELWHFEKVDRIFLTQENIADYVAWQTDQGTKIVSVKDLKENQTIYDAHRDGDWSAPWLLLFREKNARPLLLVFPSQPQKIIAEIRFGILNGFEISPGKEKTLMAGWPWGVLQRELDGFSKNIPDEALTKIHDLLGLALTYPVDRDEYFRLDPLKQQIRFRMNVKYRTFPNDWKIEVKPLVCLPPMTAYLARLNSKDKNSILSPAHSTQEGDQFHRSVNTQYQLAETDEILQDFDIPTPFGPMTGKPGTAIEWSLFLPEPKDLLLVNVKDEKINILQNKLFLDGVKWTCGGHVPLNQLSPSFPSGPQNDNPNISHFTWNFGIGPALQSRLLLNTEAKKELEKRVAIRTIEPMELYQHKSFARHRSEPFSGLQYPVMFNSFYPNDTNYEKNFGSQVIYGDTNESATVVAWTGQELADIYGMRDLIQTNWSFYRYVMRHQIYIDDYCYQSGSCRESGAGAWIDMLNAEYSGLIAYARLADIVGDEETRLEALARAAKRAVPTIARIVFKPWFERLHPEFIGRNYLITGFGEEGAKVITFPTRSGNFCMANDLFDYSQGIPGTQFYLYRKFARKEIETYLTNTAYPQLIDKNQQPGYAYLGPLALYAPNVDIVDEYANTILNYPKNMKAEDWPGITWPFELGAWLWRKNGQIAFSRFEDLKFHWAQYDPKSKELQARFLANHHSKLELTSQNPPKNATLNAKPVRLDFYKQETMYFCPIPLEPGINRLNVQF